MANTYTLIASTTLGSNTTGNVSFTSIPSTYTDLVLQFSLRKTGGSTVFFRFNSDSATNYSETDIANSDGAAVSSKTSSFNYGITIGGDSGYTANTFGSGEIYIPNYLSTSSRPFSSFAVAENNSASANQLYAFAELYRGTSAISRIDFTPAGDTYIAGSSFYLYGIKNS